MSSKSRSASHSSFTTVSYLALMVGVGGVFMMFGMVTITDPFTVVSSPDRLLAREISYISTDRNNQNSTPVHFEIEKNLLLTNNYITNRNRSKYNIFGWHLMGIEGSGHHMWYSFTKLFRLQKFEPNRNAARHENITWSRKKALKSSIQHSQKMKIVSLVKSIFNRKLSLCWKATKEQIPIKCDFVDIKNRFNAAIREKLNIQNIGNIPDNTLFILPWASYPFGNDSATNIPRILPLIPLLNQVKNKPIELKVIVQIRDAMNMITSVARRFPRGFSVRLKSFDYILSMMQNILLVLQRREWMIIEFDKILLRPREYSVIILTFLNLQNDYDIVIEFETCFTNRIKPSKNYKQLTMDDKWKKLKYHLAQDNSTRSLVNTETKWRNLKYYIYYTFFEYRQWTLFQNGSPYITTPENFVNHSKENQWY